MLIGFASNQNQLDTKRVRNIRQTTAFSRRFKTLLTLTCVDEADLILACMLSRRLTTWHASCTESMLSVFVQASLNARSREGRWINVQWRGRKASLPGICYSERWKRNQQAFFKAEKQPASRRWPASWATGISSTVVDQLDQGNFSGLLVLICC